MHGSEPDSGQIDLVDLAAVLRQPRVIEAIAGLPEPIIDAENRILAAMATVDEPIRLHAPKRRDRWWVDSLGDEQRETLHWAVLYGEAPIGSLPDAVRCELVWALTRTRRNCRTCLLCGFGESDHPKVGAAHPFTPTVGTSR